MGEQVPGMAEVEGEAGDGDAAQAVAASGKKAAKPGPAAASAKASAMTPMMAQYTEIKAANPDSLLFYRMGDFYELFFDDAVQASEALGITLTKRGKHLGDDIPMAGVPVHAADDYLQRLIRAGFRVAVCEQTEDPAEARKRGAKSVVRRDVTRLVTPGTLTEDTLLTSQNANYLTACFPAPQSDKDSSGRRAALASVDISTGAFLVGEVAFADLAGELARLLPSEILVPDTALADAALAATMDMIGAARTPLPSAHFRAKSGERDLKDNLGVADLAAFGAFTRSELAAVGGLLKYLDLTQIGQKPLLRAPRKTGPSSVMAIDAATRANLELVRTTSGERKASLLDSIDLTVTGAGARELAARLSSPLIDPDAIAARLDVVDFFLDARVLRDGIRSGLRQAPDMARAISRLTVGRGGPRDLGAVRDALQVAISCRNELRNTATPLGLPDELQRLATQLDSQTDALAEILRDALVEELPVHRRDGGFVQPGYSADLDENCKLRDESRNVLVDMQVRYQESTGIKGLKVKHNNVLGYFVEVNANNGDVLRGAPHDEMFRHKQTLANAVRFVTDELSDIEGRITAAGDRALAIEQEIFSDLARQVDDAQEQLTSLADALAELDCYAALALVAEQENYTRPKIDRSEAFVLYGARHPVVEQALRKSTEGPFIENDCILGHASLAPGATDDTEFNQPAGPHGGFDELGDARIWVVTGPNMAGKSTFLRQNALIAVMAQMGSFVPARHAHIGVIDRLFSRVGASDDLARGRSTFMVEMVETAGILNLATDRSLVILDEIGRGTATFDGLSIAWATVEYLQDVNRCRALFATHYHELTALAARLPDAENVTMAVKEWKDEIVFLHKVVPGAADRSYGIQVARLAGLPAPVIDRAGEVLHLLEENDNAKTPDALIDDLPLFAATRPTSAGTGKPQASPTLEALAEINPDALTPREALEALYRLKDLDDGQ